MKALIDKIPNSSTYAVPLLFFSRSKSRTFFESCTGQGYALGYGTHRADYSS